MAIHIGTSGWSYRHWRGSFYPAGLRPAKEFAFYVSRFDACELNGVFYRLPSEAAVAKWAQTAPPGFVFAWKVSNYLTHRKRLKEPAESLELIFGRMAGLGDHQGPALFQLHPRMARDDGRLAAVLELLPPGVRCAVEFRHPSWYAEPVYDLLRAHDVALCLSDHHDAPSPWVETASWLYVRGHGPAGDYRGRYPDATLAAWADRIAAVHAAGGEAHAYFDNDIDVDAPRDAERLRALLGG